jgi:hypothetical protein
VLDLVVDPDGTLVRRDEDELAFAVAQGVFSAAAAIEADAVVVETLGAEWRPPFCDGWEALRPDPTWPTPSLNK